MSLRAVVIGLLGATFVSAYTYFNDAVMRQTMFVGNHMPISVYGGLIIFLLVVNPLLLWAHRRLALTGRELAVILALTLAVCVIPGSGLLRAFTTSIMMPHHYNRTEPGWKDSRVIELVPARMLAGIPPEYEEGDILDPRAVARALVVTGRGRTPQQERVASLVDAAAQREIVEALNASLTPPAARWRDDAVAGLDEAIACRTERLATLAGGAETAKREFSADARASLVRMIEDALSAPREDSLGGHDAARGLSRILEELGFERGERRAVLEPVEQGLATAEAPCTGAVVEALNDLLDSAELYSEGAFPGAQRPEEAAAAGVASLPQRKRAAFNRTLLDRAFGESVRSLEAKENTAVGGFIQGLPVGDDHIALGEIPWYAWTRTFGFWLPLILTVWIAVVALSVILHKQWSQHEQLPYPIAAFANSLLPVPGSSRGSVFTNRLFLVGGAAVLAIHLNNYLCVWFPSLIPIPTTFEFWSLQDLWPLDFIRRGGGWFFFAPKIYFTPLAFAFFITTSVSFSLGIGATLFALISGVLMGYGIAMHGGSHYYPSYAKLLTAGAYVGILATTIYTGRHYYLNTFRQALRLKSKEQIGADAVWAARVFLVTMLAFVVQLMLVGLDWQIALAYAVMTIGLFTVMSRVCAETGVFFIQPGWAPCILLVGLFGARAFGPTTMAVLFMVTMVLLIDPREALMPYVANALKILEFKKVSIGRPAMLLVGAIVVGLAVALPITLYYQYDRAAHMTDGWAAGVVPKLAFEEATRAKSRLQSQGSLADSESTRGFARLANVTLTGGNILSFVAGVALVVGFAFARWRIPWWPIHPVMFIVWSGYAGYMLAASLLVGCVIKFVVMKYGGEPIYQRIKPLMYGLIAGDMLGGILPSIIGFVYYVATGQPPRSFVIMPT